MTNIRLPAMFFNDHAERELPTPVVVRETARYVWVSADDPGLTELLDDARYYAEGAGLCSDYAGLKRSAQATVRALEKAEM